MQKRQEVVNPACELDLRVRNPGAETRTSRCLVYIVANSIMIPMTGWISSCTEWPIERLESDLINSLSEPTLYATIPQEMARPTCNSPEVKGYTEVEDKAQERLMNAFQEARQRYAQMLREKAQLKSDALVRAFAHVPRERFLGPGPWRVTGEQMVSEPTQDDNPIHLYHDVLVAIDPARQLNNGLPSGLAKWFDALELREGEHVVHIGCGTGYYSAILAHVVGTAGRVTAIELDPNLASWARRNLDDLPQVAVVCANGADQRSWPRRRNFRQRQRDASVSNLDFEPQAER